jgi:dihydrofolate reductase
MNIIYVAVSLDGFIAEKDGNLDWLDEIPNKTKSDYGFSDFLKRIDCIVMGRKTLEKVLEFEKWPYTKPVYVLSTTLTELPLKLDGKAEIISGKLNDLIGKLNSQGFKDLYIDGGQTIQSFLNEDLIDEMIISTVPIILGDGIPLFANIKRSSKFKCKKVDLINPYVVKHYYERDDW